MTDTEAVKEKVELTQKHIAGQRQRIVRHKELIAQLKRDNKQDLLPTARELLTDLERVLAGMIVEHARARDELAEAHGTGKLGQTSKVSTADPRCRGPGTIP
jgi:hypothetical protein